VSDQSAAVRLLFLADSQIGCMATFSGIDDAAVERFEQRKMCVRKFPSTDSIDWDTDRYREAIQVANTERPDLIVIGGDMIDAIDQPEQLDAFRQVTDELDDIDVHYVAGNHDACYDATIPTDESLDWYRSTFGPDHYSFTHPVGDATATFVVVNSTLLDQPRKVPGGDERELAFLEGELRSAAGRGPIVVFSHHPPYVGDPDEADNYWNLPQSSRRPFLELLVEHQVDLVLSGHRHRNHRVVHEGVEIITSGATGFPLGTDPPGYRLVEIGEEEISHSYYGVGQPGWEDIGGPPDSDEC
jgi:predicted phosphodiesterase